MEISKKRVGRFLSLIIMLIMTFYIVPKAVATVAEVTSVDDNTAPIAKNLEFVTYKGVGITGTLQAVDPEGDLLEYKLITEPKKGTVDVTENGQFTYTPNEGKKGKDSFTYVAVDAVGNVSEEATVKIVIQKQSTKVTYSDMEGNSAHYSAVKLAEEGIFVGEVIGDYYFFNPDLQVTRGEFLVMCLKANGADILDDITRTGFADDEEIGSWLKPYVTTALMDGAIKGIHSNSGELVFAPNEPITMAQAAVILDNTMELTDAKETSVQLVNMDMYSGWAYQATVNLSSIDVQRSIDTDIYSTSMTRADAAVLLASVLDAAENESSDSLLSWAQ